jgi:HD-like signal output (HDOD) protein
MTDQRPVALDFDLPAQPQSLAKLAALLREDDVNLNRIGALIDSDMSFAAAVMKAVNSPLYGLKGRVQSVQQAVTYLGVREISAIAYESGLQAAFPQVPQLQAVWERARLRGLLMGRLAQALSMEAWGAHTAGLFEECGKAVLFRHDPARYAALLAQAPNDEALLELERQAFATTHEGSAPGCARPGDSRPPRSPACATTWRSSPRCACRACRTATSACCPPSPTPS